MLPDDDPFPKALAPPSPSKRALRVVSLAEFLRQAAPGADTGLPPLVHSTPAKNLFDILDQGRLTPLPCTVFQERLCYLFVGRPAYKWTTRGEASHWQLPLVFVFKDAGGARLKRIFPFDSGAFASRRLPDYIATFDMERFNLGSDTDAAGALIQTYFGGQDSYVRGVAINDAELRARHALNVRHQEVEALARLYGERSNQDSDDRAKTIELQVAENVELSAGNLLGVVLPHQHASDPDIAAELATLNCRVESYGEYPMRADSYYGMIYERVQKIIKADRST